MNEYHTLKGYKNANVNKHTPLVELFVLYSSSNDKNNQILFKDINRGYCFKPANTNNYSSKMVIFNRIDDAKRFIKERTELKLVILPLRS